MGTQKRKSIWTLNVGSDGGTPATKGWQTVLVHDPHQPDGKPGISTSFLSRPSLPVTLAATGAVVAKVCADQHQTSLASAAE